MALNWANDEEDPKLTNQLTPGTSTQEPPMAPPPAVQMPPAPPTVAPQAPVQSKPLLAKPLPGMPPDVTPDELGEYLNKQKQGISKFGPQEQMDLENSLAARRNSLGYRATDSLKGLSDALMQGVAGEGNPGNQAQFEGKEMTQGQERLGVMQKAHEEQGQDTEAGMKIDMMNAQSPISKAYRQSFAPIFTKMGYSPKDIAKMSASQVGTVADLGVRFADAQTQLELKEALLGVEKYKTSAEIANQQSERKMDATKQLGGMPWYSRLFHPGISGALEKQAGLNEPEAHQPSGWKYVGKVGDK